MNTWN
ncbi:hypothetical protein VC95412_002860A, partial [Vibrio cholerae O1 str. 95412]